MPPKELPICPHYRKGRCSYGQKCKFRHIGPSLAPSSSAKPPSPSKTRRSVPAVSSSQPHTPTPGAPRGFCPSFREAGRCDRGNGCKLLHEPQSRLATAPSTYIPATFSTEDLDEGLLERYVDPFSDGFAAAYSLPPGQVRKQMRRFTGNESRFETNDEIYRFSAMLGSANAYNSSWVGLVGHEQPNGEVILRIQDILLHESVSSEASQIADLSFQKAYLPILGYFSSRWVLRSTLRRNMNALYGLLDHNFETVESILHTSIEGCMLRKSFSDVSTSVSGLQVFCTVGKCLHEYATRFKNAVAQHPCFANLVAKLVEWSNSWAIAVCASPPGFDDPIAGWSSSGKSFAVDHMKKTIESLFEVVERAEGSTLRRSHVEIEIAPREATSQALLDKLLMTYDGPGVYHEGGVPRHDNDKENVSQIEIVPTHAELTCSTGPYLPANIPGGPHHLPGSSMERLVDIQFRLLREELIAPIRSSLAHVLHDCEQPPDSHTQLDILLAKCGGLYKATQSAWDSTMFSVYTGVNFRGIECDVRRGLAVNLTFDTPRGRATDPSAVMRAAYWEGVGKRRLMQGGLLGLLWVPPNSEVHDIRFYLGTVASGTEDLVHSARQSADRLALKVSFFDPEVDLRILSALQDRRPRDEGMKLLLEAPIMFESIRPFLETLKGRPPASIPFARYIAHQDNGDLSSVSIDPPAYVTPRFAFKLDSLFECNPPIKLSLRPQDQVSVKNARETLRNKSRLDPSQVDAMIGALTSEVSLIQGPPGTGKSFTGVELLRVLISNGIKPILLIAFTNHALDNIITHVLDKGITENIVRLGSRSNDESLAKYTLEQIMRNKSSHANKSAGKQWAMMKDAQEKMSRLMFRVVSALPEEEDLRPYLQRYYPQYHHSIYHPPSWISRLLGDSTGWQKVLKRGSREKTPVDVWKAGEDIAFITPPADPAVSGSQGPKGLEKQGRGPMRGYDLLPREADEDPSTEEEDAEPPSWLTTTTKFFADLNFISIPQIPLSNRPLEKLLNSRDVWSMSMEERRTLLSHWADEARECARDPQKAEFDGLKRRHAEARSAWSDIMDQAKQKELSEADLIGCTTNGAAKLTSLLQSVGPKVLLVEEAGQVLEAHILASLVPSIEHLILIGDPLQLRPTIENYQLSMENSRTGKVFRFDQSLMERLSSMGLPMSQLDVQRRMRPQIADLVRRTLYPALKDHALVQASPPVRGMSRDVFFLDHRHGEDGGGEESVSKTNTYEAEMIKDLVLYLLRQGKYTRAGDIVVLCAYLGQLAKVRKLLSSEVATMIDERDAVQLLDHDNEADAAEILAESTEQVHVAERVLLRTVDNFQGEEGTIVILSLVRNSGESPTAGRKIGFLKSTNRVNVALSRAREGLYILGNSDDLLASGSDMWSEVIDQLRRNDQIGSSFPLSCSRHPGTIIQASEPGDIAIYAPDGGCLEECNALLTCGHRCHLHCHPDDPQHRAIRCSYACTRFCSRGHPCKKPCADPCGPCEHSTNFQLPCGHISPVRCYQIDSPQNIRCFELVQKLLPQCGHSVLMACSDDAGEAICQMTCGKVMTCCGAVCKDLCGNCQAVNPPGFLTKHTDHPCGRQLYCGHICSGVCNGNHDCANVACQDQCRQGCRHHACDLPCTEPCAPCMDSCDWVCEHQGRCQVVCGAPCARLPCDERCEYFLDCGHRCPSVCGEPCEEQICPLCVTRAVRSQVVDLIEGKQLREIDPDGEDLNQLIITLTCKHTFTVKTLDGICQLEKFYIREFDTWTSIAPSPEGLQRPPACPHCHGPIKSLRYGRVYKRAYFDISEQNVATKSSWAMGLIRESVDALDSAKAAQDLETALEDVKLVGVRVEEKEAAEEQAYQRKQAIPPNEPLPVTSKRFSKKCHHLEQVPQSIKEPWTKATRRLIAYYDEASELASATSAHVQAYEAAVATLSQEYLAELGHSNDLPGSMSPEDMALGLARRRCGLPALPKADVRFQVEACWLTFNIRFQLASLAQKAAGIFVKEDVPQKLRSLWADMIEDILYSVERDALLTIDVALNSQSNRQVVRTVLFLIEAQYQIISHRVDRYLNSIRLGSLKDEVRKAYAEAKAMVAKYGGQFREAMNSRPTDQQWLEDNYITLANSIFEKWTILLTQLEKGSLNNQAPAAQNSQTVKALMDKCFGITPRGHFYQCPKGHVYVITECGSTMDVSRCPECNSLIVEGFPTLSS
ncbi:hypothetical protein M407DRAFT_226703 [Tulasnella calospora MUT 4182]|uniref:P-loop containing nucleoside triphosphate hydrolase protein n=1 Tax=Tulasnella calospora MUT 4182 TaxID=1051891 RepID=A0A0C3K9A3_9AGAM|nr:hypothetical protein M407DRAFT_226703 [Tulasnella calospora MUT 4182]